MTLIEVKEYLYSNLVDKTLTITYAEENAFNGLVFALSKHSFAVENCTINSRPENIPNEIIVTGISKLTDNSNSVINGRLKIQINITADKNNNAVYIFAAAVDGIYTMSEYFGSLAPQYMRGYSDGDTEKKNAYLKFLPGVMGGFKLTNPVILYNSAEKNDYFNLPLNFSAGFLFGALPPGSLWADDFSAILDNFNTTVTGALSLRPMYENYIPFIIKIALGDKSMFPGLPQSHKLYTADGGIFPSKAGLALIFQHALTFNDFDTLSCPTSAGAYLQLGFKFDSIEPPFNFTTPIFRTEDFWTLNVTFPDGLGIIDIINFFSSLFGVSGKSGLLLPADLNINIMKLYQMNFGMSRNGNNLGLKEVYAVLGMSRSWELFSGLTLNNLGMYWHIQWGKTSHLLTGGIGAELQIALTSSKILTLKAGAAIPNLDIYASLELTDAEKTAKKYQLQDVLGDSAVNSLPKKENFAIAKFEVNASYYGRSLSIYSEINAGDFLSITLGNVNVNLGSIYGSASFTQSGNSYMLGGEIDFNDETKNELLFGLSLEGSYSDSTWKFSGRLIKGKVSIINLISKFAGISADTKFDVEISALNIDYSYDSEKELSDYSILAGFNKNFPAIFGFSTSVDGRVLVKSNKDKNNYLSVMLGVKIGNFGLIAQVDNFYDEQNRINYLTLGYKESFIRGSYYKKGADELVNISFQNVTFGDIVSWIISTINPNLNYGLPSPWDILNKIDLSKMSFEINITKKTFTFKYNIDLNILGIATMEYIGINYSYDDTKKDKFQIVAKTNLTEEPFGFDPVNENPPDIAQNPKLFHLSFLGLGQHLSTAEINNATSISSAMTAMLDNFNENKLSYSENTNWLFAAKFSIKDSLQVSLILNDPNLYGLLVEVINDTPPFSVLKGLVFEILYKKITKDVGMFKAALTLPDRIRHFELGVVSVTIGSFGVEIYTNGSFLIDLGFPYNNDFSRSFAFEMGYFAGKGGFYFGVLTGDICAELPPVTHGFFESVLKIAIGLNVGIGRNFDFGIVSGGLSLSVFGVFEGLFAIWKDNNSSESAMYMKVKTTVGVIGQIYVRVNLVIITLDASAVLKAFAVLTIESYRKTDISLDVSITLKAKVKILFIKINVSFNFSNHFSFSIGNNSIAPWGNAYLSAVHNDILDNIFTPDKIYADKINIALNYSPIFSLDQKKSDYIIGFIPVLQNNEFNKFENLLCDWTLHKFTDTITATDVIDNLTDERLEKEVTYDIIDAFLGNNAQISITDISSNGNMDGVVFAMPPLVDTFKLTGMNGETPTEILSRDFSTFSPITQNYIETINNYFKCFEEFADSIVRLRCINEQTTPIAKVIFLDYTHMIIRYIMREIRELYRQFDIKFDKTEMFGLSLTQIISDNLNVKIKSTNIVILSKNIVVSSNDTFENISKNIEITVGSLIRSNKNKISIFRTGAIINVPGFEYKNVYNLDNKVVAAMFFVRHGLFEKEEYYRDYVTLIFPQIMVENPVNWTADGTENFKINAGAFTDYKPIAGDTIEILAKVCALICKFNDGSYPAWNNYLESFLITNISASIKITENLSMSNWIIRIFAVNDSANLNIFANQTIFADLAGITAENVSVPISAGTDIKTLLTNNNITIEEFAKAIIVENIEFTSDITIKNAVVITKAFIKSHVKSDDFVNLLSGAVSRFMLQGARLPIVSDITKTDALYNIIGQQSNLNYADYDGWNYIIGIGNGASSWITGKTEITINKKDLKVNENIPDPAFNWTDLYEVSEIDYFDKLPKTYPITDGFICSGAAYHLFGGVLTADFAKITFPVIKYENSIISAAYGVMLKIDIAPGNDVIIIKGLSPKDRITLIGILEKAGNNPVYKLLYKPSSLNGLANTLIEKTKKPNDVIIKTNLSRETHMFPEDKIRDEDDIYAANYGTKDFLTLIWQCSVIGGGYYLCFEEPVDNVSIEENPCLWLFISDNGNIKEYVNCAVSGEVSLIGNNESLTLYSDIAEEYDSEPLAAAGNYGVKIVSTNKFDTQNDTHELFSIISYKVKGGDYTADLTKKVSKPLIPIDDDKNNTRIYYATLPLYKNISGVLDINNPYNAINKPVQFEIYCRDVLGNFADGTILSNIITPDINDILIGVHEWAGVSVTFTFQKNLDNIQAVITFNSKLDRISEEQKAVIQKSIYQLAVSTAKLRGDFIGEVNLVTEDIQKIIDFGKSIILTPAGQNILQIIKNIEIDSTRNINSLRLNIAVSRNGIKANLPPGALTAVSVIKPYVTDEYKVADFSLNAENVLGNNYKVAFTDKAESELYLVNLSLFLPQIEIKPFADNVPYFFAFRPVSNKPVTRTVDIKSLENGKLSDNTVSVNYTNIDVDQWAERFLGDIENVLSTDFAAELAKLNITDNAGVIKLLSAKETLAEAISTYLIPVANNVSKNGNISCNIVKDRLLKNLVLGNKISCAAEYDMTVSTPSNIRLELNIVNNAGDAGRIIIGECKIDLMKSRASLIITASSIYDSGFNLDNLTVTVRDIEYDIASVGNGYETSKWLRFVMPLNTDSSTIKVNFSSSLTAPNPLRKVPQMLNLKGQSCADSKNYYNWKHTVNCEAVAALQDTHNFSIKYSEELTAKKEDGVDLFTLLAQYDYIRSELINNIAAAECFTIFSEIVRQTANLWAVGILTHKLNADNDYVMKCNVQIAAKEGTYYIDLINLTPNYSVSAQNQTTIEPGKNYNFDLIVDNLSIYNQNIAETSVQTTRNDNILGNLTVNPLFIYQTEVTSLPYFPAYLYRNKIELAGNYSSVSDILNTITEVLNLNNVTDIMCVVVKYLYSLGGSANICPEIPLFYYPNISSNTLLDIAPNIDNWYNQSNICKNNSVFIFEICVYNKTQSRIILQIDKIVAKMKPN